METGTATGRQRLLVVDDETELTEMLAEFFEGQGYQVVQAHSALQARREVEQAVPLLALLDVHMPGESGLDLARWLRARHPDLGIIMLTTAAGVLDRIAGLQAAADDYIAKPFDLREVLARVQSVLRRTAPAPLADQQRCRVGEATLDLREGRLFGADGSELALTAMEFDLLKVFLAHPNETLNRDQLMVLAHHKNWDALDRSIDLRIMRLRRKIERDPDKPDVLKTVRGAGYRYCTT